MKRIEWLLARKEETVLNVFKLKTMVRENDTLAVLFYGSPDPDAVASAMALREILNQTKPLAKCIFVATEPVIRYQNAEFIREMKVEIQMLDKVDLREYRLIAVVDGQPTFFGELLGETKPQIVLDHHPCKSTWHASLADVRPSYGALSTIMTEYLLAARVRIPKRLYTALLYGIRGYRRLLPHFFEGEPAAYPPDRVEPDSRTVSQVL
jgi:nanoRNase/pAp phosphatase (c-di-AMP/oligoRNAs hydrolase)